MTPECIVNIESITLVELSKKNEATARKNVIVMKYLSFSRMLGGKCKIIVQEYEGHIFTSFAIFSCNSWGEMEGNCRE